MNQRRNLRRLSNRKSSNEKLRKPISRELLVKILAGGIRFAELAIKLVELISKIVGGMG